MTTEANQNNQRQSLFTLKEVQGLIAPPAVLSLDDILNHAVLGDVKLCVIGDLEFGVIGRIDLRLLGLANDPNSDGHFEDYSDWLGLLNEYRSEDTGVVALFLTQSDCMGIKTHKIYPQTVFRSAYKIKGASMAEEVTPFDVVWPDTRSYSEEDSTLISREFDRFCLFPKEPQYGWILSSTSQTMISYDMPTPINLTVDKLYITESELQRLVSLNNLKQPTVSQNENWVAQSHTSHMLERLNLTAKLLWKGKNKSEPQNYPKKNEIITALNINPSFKLSPSLRDVAISIIHPIFARKELSIDARSKDSSYLSPELEALKDASDKFWKNANLADYDTYLGSNNSAVEEWLMDQYNFSGKKAKAGASIIRPEGAKGGRPPKEK